MKTKGFTLMELIAIVTLLGLLLIVVFPKILNISEKKQLEIDESKKQLVYNAVLDYMNQNMNSYPQDLGNQYCILIDTLDRENLIPVYISDITENYNYIRIKIGLNNNHSFTFIKAENEEKCKGV